jgi:hypothetical protein
MWQGAAQRESATFGASTALLDFASALSPTFVAPMPATRIVRQPISRAELRDLAAAGFGDMVKAVVDIGRGIMAIDAELHSDEEAALLDDGSAQADLWGINLYPAESGDTWIEFDSMINVRPTQGNRSRRVDDEALAASIRRVVAALVVDA